MKRKVLTILVLLPSILLIILFATGTTIHRNMYTEKYKDYYIHKFDYKARWFQPKAFESALYQKLRIRKWKKYIPTYNPDSFSLKSNSLEQILQNMCQAEVVHLLIIAASFLPLLLSFLWDSFGVFLVTSLLSAAFDLVFVIAQRYNRPRFIRLLAKTDRET